jgi:hypothetical protein
MFPPVNTKDPVAVEVEVQSAYLTLFPSGDPKLVPRIFGWVVDGFMGGRPDYLPIDAAYHDLEHTLQGALCLNQILRTRHQSAAHPPVPKRLFELGILAILLHDTGYLKRTDDREGTGAKYTATHVHRSAEFAAALMTEKGYPALDILAVRNMIQCTGVDASLARIGFQSEAERTVGLALGSADLIGQMAAVDYVEKLPVLYSEFAEAAQFTKDKSSIVGMFANAQDLVRKTPTFWGYTKNRLTRDFGGLYRFLNDPYPFGPNHYLERIEANIERIRQLLSKP